LSEVNDERVWVYRGKKVNVETNCWYDRAMGRCLFFGQFVPPPGVVDWERFGSPVPPYPFFVESGNRWIPKKPSYWMYPMEKGETRDHGKRAEVPSPTRLPRTEVLLAIPEFGGLDEGSGDNEDGMEISNLEVENPASNVVTIADVNDDISAQTFQVLTRDAFSNSNVRPLSIIHTQGLMLIWVRFMDVSAGRRGFGALGAVWKKMRIVF
jgi:hypothetical protein